MVELGECSVLPTKQVQCTITQPAEYFKLYNVTVTAMFGSKAGPAAEWTLPVVSTPPVTPQTLAALYNIPPNVYATNGSQAVGEFEQQYYSPSDLALFFKMMGITGADTPVTVVGFNNGSHPGAEANLDIQVRGALLCCLLFVTGGGGSVGGVVMLLCCLVVTAYHGAGGAHACVLRCCCVVGRRPSQNHTKPHRPHTQYIMGTWCWADVV